MIPNIRFILAPVVGHLAFDQLFNLFEGVLWLLIAAVLAFRALRDKQYKALKAGVSVSFFIFGISDFIEIYTRAWYSPWQLFVLNAACVVSLFIHLILYIRLSKKIRPAD